MGLFTVNVMDCFEFKYKYDSPNVLNDIYISKIMMDVKNRLDKFNFKRNILTDFYENLNTELKFQFMMIRNKIINGLTESDETQYGSSDDEDESCNIHVSTSTSDLTDVINRYKECSDEKKAHKIFKKKVQKKK